MYNIMYKLISKIIDRLEQGLTPRDKIIVVALMLVISVLGIILADRYYNYIQKNPEFCSSCHLMGDAYKAWKLSGHRTIVCQNCHQLGMIEQNRLLVKFVFTTNRKTPEPHGNETPWKACTKCHWDEAKQGAISVNKSIGHARHVFTEKVACKQCHLSTVHSFKPDKTACLRCHKDWKIHGVGMQDLSCLRCHAFSPRKEETFIPDRKLCLSCHKTSARTTFPENAPMARLNCYECHRPHKNIKTSDSDCLRCHSRYVLAEQPVHASTQHCRTCHRPHRWTPVR
ncbi:MAG TPA: cytochrome c3 family protein [Nitrospirota bacterium]|nr:cytochrome c3 family protein [Nitrospirota bacterium]